MTYIISYDGTGVGIEYTTAKEAEEVAEKSSAYDNMPFLVINRDGWDCVSIWLEGKGYFRREKPDEHHK